MPEPNATPRALKVDEVATALQVGRKTVLALIARGDLHAVKVGRVWRVPTEALDAYLRRERHL